PANWVRAIEVRDVGHDFFNSWDGSQQLVQARLVPEHDFDAALGQMRRKAAKLDAIAAAVAAPDDKDLVLQLFAFPTRIRRRLGIGRTAFPGSALIFPPALGPPAVLKFDARGHEEDFVVVRRQLDALLQVRENLVKSAEQVESG